MAEVLSKNTSKSFFETRIFLIRKKYVSKEPRWGFPWWRNFFSVRYRPHLPEVRVCWMASSVTAWRTYVLIRCFPQTEPRRGSLMTYFFRNYHTEGLKGRQRLKGKESDCFIIFAAFLALHALAALFVCAAFSALLALFIPYSFLTCTSICGNGKLMPADGSSL